MVDVITANNRHKFASLIDQMHRDRKAVFVDRLKWDVPVVDGIYEIDQFDIDDAIYLVATDPKHQHHLGSVRLLPSKGPHLLGDVFPHLCDQAVPVGDDVWEITRMCTHPSKELDALAIRRLLVVALCEFGLLYGIRTYTVVTHMQMVSALIAVGWECEPLGEPQLVAGDMVGALAIKISPATLQFLRSRAPSRLPVLQLNDIAEAA
jgi:acyl-homoserine lactone synthase